MSQRFLGNRFGASLFLAVAVRALGLAPAGLGWLCSQAAGQSAEAKVRSLTDELVQAGNYSWQQKRNIDIDSRGNMPRGRMPTFASGKTSVGEFTVATVQKRSVAALGEKVAYMLPDGIWRHIDDLTNDELQELGFFGAGSRIPYAYARGFRLLLPHELLETLLAKGNNLRRVGVSYEGDLSLSITEMMELETMLRGHPIRLTRPTRQPSIFSAGRLLPERPADRSASFTIYADKGAISEVLVTRKREMKIAFNGGERESHTSTIEYQFKIFDIGQTIVDVHPEAQAILSVR